MWGVLVDVKVCWRRGIFRLCFFFLLGLVSCSFFLFVCLSLCLFFCLPLRVVGYFCFAVWGYFLGEKGRICGQYVGCQAGYFRELPPPVRPCCREAKVIDLDLGRRLVPVIGSLPLVLCLGIGLVLSQSVGFDRLGSVGCVRPFRPAAGATLSGLGRENSRGRAIFSLPPSAWNFLGVSAGGSERYSQHLATAKKAVSLSVCVQNGPGGNYKFSN